MFSVFRLSLLTTQLCHLVAHPVGHENTGEIML
jgi:hypothetical protein